MLAEEGIVLKASSGGSCRSSTQRSFSNHSGYCLLEFMQLLCLSSGSLSLSPSSLPLRFAVPARMAAFAVAVAVALAAFCCCILLLHHVAGHN